MIFNTVNRTCSYRHLVNKARKVKSTRFLLSNITSSSGTNPLIIHMGTRAAASILKSIRLQREVSNLIMIYNLNSSIHIIRLDSITIHQTRRSQEYRLHREIIRINDTGTFILGAVPLVGTIRSSITTATGPELVHTRSRVRRNIAIRTTRHNRFINRIPRSIIAISNSSNISLCRFKTTRN